MSTKPIVFSLVYNRLNKLNDQGEAIISIQAYKDGKKYFVSTGIYIKPDQWNESTQKITKHPQSAQLNIKIQKTVQQLQDIQQRHSYNNPSFGIDELKTQWKNKSVIGFISYIESRLPKETNLSPGTMARYQRTIEKFKDYTKREVQFHELTFSFVNDYNDYLIKNKLSGKSRKNEFKTLGKYANLAVNEGLIEHTKNPFRGFRIEEEPNHREALNEIELKKIEALEFDAKNKHLELIRDLFLMQCYTGLRFGDAAKLCQDHIFETPEGLEIRIKAQKNSKAVNIPLGMLFKAPGQKETKPEALIKKYYRADNLPFFLTKKAQQNTEANNQYTNRELKKIQELAKVKTKIHNHIGRHTFATFLIWRVPLPVVQELLQHSKAETTSIYLSVNGERVKEQLKKITDWF